MAEFANVERICKEAFSLLRQDITKITAENWEKETPIEVAKCKLAIDSAISEVLESFRWSADVTADNVSSWSRRMQNALVYCLARELAIPIAGRMEDMKNLDALYRDKLSQAQIADYEAGKAAISDPDIRELFSLIIVGQGGETNRPSSIVDIIERINDLKKSARLQVLLAHDWNFAKVVDRVNVIEPDTGIEDEYRFVAPYPSRALRIVNVYTYGESNEWKIEGRNIRATRPITYIRYTKDVEDTTRWTATARVAFIHRLAADVARTVFHNNDDFVTQNQSYVVALENAKLHDARESATPTDVWGESYMKKKMFGTRPRKPWEI